MKKHFLTFANSEFDNLERIKNQVQDFENFDFVYCCSEINIPEFIEKHHDFIKKNSIGYGLWIWKPKIIYDFLLKLNNDDILVYADAGVYVNKNGTERFEYYLSLLKEDKYLCVFSTNDYYKSQHFVKIDAVMNYNPEFVNNLSNACYAGLMIIKRSEISLQIIKDWLDLCENYHFIDKSPSVNYKELSNFKGNDCDNGLFNLVLSNFKDYISIIYPDEVNVYSNGKQIVHTGINLENVDWSELNKIPFQIRRITKKFYKK
jgi:hypothetical protein